MTEDRSVPPVTWTLTFTAAEMDLIKGAALDDAADSLRNIVLAAAHARSCVRESLIAQSRMQVALNQLQGCLDQLKPKP